MDYVFMVMALLFLAGIILMAIGTRQSRVEGKKAAIKTDGGKNLCSKAGYGLLAVSCVFFIYWFLFR